MERSARRRVPEAASIEPPAEAEPFKSCPCCGWRWATRESFLSDPDIVPIGYMVNFKQLELGLLHFNHAPCKTTMAIKAERFTDLYEGPIFLERRTGSAECPGLCLDEQELRPCTAPCECAFVRSVLDQVSHWSKS